MAEINPFSTLLDDDTGDHDGLLYRVEAAAAASKQRKVSQPPTPAGQPGNFKGRGRVYNNNTYRGGRPGRGQGWYPGPVIYNQGYMWYNDGRYYHNGGYHGQEIEYDDGGYYGQGPEEFFDNGRYDNYNEGGYGRGGRGRGFNHGRNRSGYRGGVDRRGEEEEYLHNEGNQGYVDGGHDGGIGGYRGGRGGRGYYRGENRGVSRNGAIRRWVERGRVANEEVDGAGKNQLQPVQEGGKISEHQGEGRQVEGKEYLDEGHYPNKEGYVEEYRGGRGGRGFNRAENRGVYRNGVIRRWVERGRVASEEVDGAGKKQQELVQEGGKISEQASSKGNETTSRVDAENAVEETDKEPVVEQAEQTAPDETKTVEQSEQGAPSETNTGTEKKKKKKKKRKSKVVPAPHQEPEEEDMSNKLTLDVYQKSQQEKRKALDDMKMQERKVDKEQYEGMQLLGKFTKPKEEEVVFIKIQKSKEKKPNQKEVDEEKKEVDEKAKEQKKAPQVMTINELGFRVPVRVRGRGYSTGRGGANYHATNDGQYSSGQYSSSQGRGYHNSDSGYQGGFYNRSVSTQGDYAGHEGPNAGGYRGGNSNGRVSNGGYRGNFYDRPDYSQEGFARPNDGAYHGRYYDRDASTQGDFAGRGASNGGGYRGHSIGSGYFNRGGASSGRMGGGRSNYRRPRPPPSVEDLSQFPALQKAPEAMTAPEAAPEV